MSDQHAESVRETHHYWEPVDPEPPEGWRRCDMSEFSKDGEVWFVLYTDAPRGKNPHKFNTYWRKYRRLTQVRYVTPWVNEAALTDGSPHAD
jgi:hypothetical protein